MILRSSGVQVLAVVAVNLVAEATVPRVAISPATRRLRIIPQNRRVTSIAIAMISMGVSCSWFNVLYSVSN